MTENAACDCWLCIELWDSFDACGVYQVVGFGRGNGRHSGRHGRNVV